MRSFQLETLYASNGVFIRYRYGCYSPGLDLSNILSYVTPRKIDDGSGNTMNLIGIIVRCPPGRVLTGFNLIRPSSSTIAYSFLCAQRRSGLWCSSHSTAWSEASSQNIFLDRLNVNCPGSTDMLQHWQLQTSTGSWRINYTCCRV